MSCCRNLLQIIKLTALRRVKKKENGKWKIEKRRADKVATIKYEKLPQAGNEMHNELDKSDNNNNNSNKEAEKSNMSKRESWGRRDRGDRTLDRVQGHCAWLFG